MAKLNAHSMINTQTKRFGYYELIIFVFLLFTSVLLLHERVVDSNGMTIYLMSYRLGFVSKALVGTIFFLFTDYITANQIYIVSIIAYLILIALLSILLGFMIRRSQPDMKHPVILLVILFVSSPLSVTYLLGMNLSVFDTYLIILTLVSLILLKHPVLKWSVPLLMATAISVHQGFLFSYLPALVIPLFYEAYESYHRKRSKGNIVLLLLCGFSSASLFIAFQFFQTPLHFPNSVKFAEYLSNYADFDISVMVVDSLYFVPLKDYLYGYVLPLTASYALPFGLALLFFSLPLLIIFGAFWRNCLRATKGIFLRFIFIIGALAPLIFPPVAFLLNDWDRYWAAAINSQYILIFYFLYSDTPAAVDSIKKLGSFFERHSLLLLLIVVFSCSVKFSEAVTDLYSFIQNRAEVAKVLEDYVNNIGSGL